MAPEEEDSKPEAILGRTVIGPIPVKIQDRVKPGVKLAAKKWGVQLPESIGFGYDLKICRFGNRPIASKTTDAYNDNLRQLHRFCAIIGDYDSMLMLLLPSGTPNTPSMNVETAEQFLCLKRTPRNMELIAIGGAPVMDVDGQQVFCDGGWKAPKKAGQYQAAVSNLHVANNQEGTYLIPCAACIAAHEKKEENATCAVHSGSFPRRFRGGNPTKNHVFTNTVAKCMKDGAMYVERGDSQLLPSDLRALRTHLLSTNDLDNLQMWVVVLLGCKLFLRSDEILTVTFEDVIDELIVRVDEHVHSITFRIMGKADNKPVHMVAHSDDEYPDLCPVRALLVYVHCARITQGAVFPKLGSLHGKRKGQKQVSKRKDTASTIVEGTTAIKLDKTTEKTTSGKQLEGLQYEMFLRSFKCTAGRVLVTEDLRIGLHCLRKTGYLLAVWGEGEIGAIKYAARHETDKHAQAYRRDAELLLHDARIQGAKDNAVGKWIPNRREAIGQAGRMNLRAQTGNLNLVTAAADFVTVTLGIPLSNAYGQSPTVVMKAAVEYRKKGLDDATHFGKNQLGLDDEKAAILAKYLAMVLHRDREKRKYCEMSNGDLDPKEMDNINLPSDTDSITKHPPPPPSQFCSHLPPTTAGHPSTAAAQPQPPPTKNKPESGLDGREKLAGMPFGPDKVAAIIKILESAPENSCLGGSDKTFLSWVARPIKRCLDGHHKGDVTSFCNRWNGMFKQNFASCCTGGVTSCLLLSENE